MNKISLLILSLAIFSCQSNINQNQENSNFSDIEVDHKIEPTKKNIDNSNEQVKVNKSSKSINRNLIYVLDSIKIDVKELTDTLCKYNPNLPFIYPKELDTNLNCVFELVDSTVLISFFIDSEFEVQTFTIWESRKDSIIKYKGRIKPDFYTKYAFASILQKFDGDEYLYLIGETSGGEGGENWQSIWVSRLNELDSLIEIDKIETGYDSEEYMKSLEFDLIGKEVIIYEKTDSTTIASDSVVAIPVSKKEVKTIKLN